MPELKYTAMAVIACLCLSACGASGPSGSPSTPTSPGTPTPTPTPGGSLTISVQNNDFTPGGLTINAGQTVVWNWNSCSSDPYGYGGNTCVSHGIQFDDGTKSSIQSQGTFSRTFNTKGTYTYHCQVHGTAMSGSITVQ